MINRFIPYSDKEIQAKPYLVSYFGNKVIINSSKLEPHVILESTLTYYIVVDDELQVYIPHHKVNFTFSQLYNRYLNPAINRLVLNQLSSLYTHYQLPFIVDVKEGFTVALGKEFTDSIMLLIEVQSLDNLEDEIRKYVTDNFDNHKKDIDLYLYTVRSTNLKFKRLRYNKDELEDLDKLLRMKMLEQHIMNELEKDLSETNLALIYKHGFQLLLPLKSDNNSFRLVPKSKRGKQHPEWIKFLQKRGLK